MSTRRISTLNCSRMLAAADAREMLMEYPEWGSDRLTLLAEALLKVANQPHSTYATFAFAGELIRVIDKGLGYEIRDGDPYYTSEEH